MTRTKAILVVAFLLAFAAGTSVGLFATKAPPASPPPRPDRPNSFLERELNLTVEQKEQMKTIWSDVMAPGGRGQFDRRAALAQERDQAVVALLTEEQRSRYDAVLKDYADKVEALQQDRKRAFDEARERTKAILTPEQAEKYDQLMKRPPERGPGGGGPSARGPRHRHSGPASAPASLESNTPRVGE